MWTFIFTLITISFPTEWTTGAWGRGSFRLKFTRKQVSRLLWGRGWGRQQFGSKFLMISLQNFYYEQLRVKAFSKYIQYMHISFKITSTTVHIFKCTHLSVHIFKWCALQNKKMKTVNSVQFSLIKAKNFLLQICN